MQLMQKYEVDIDYCPQCKGVWLDRGEMDKIANIQNKYEDAHYQKYHYGRKEYDDDDDDDDYYNRRRKRGFLGELFDFDWLKKHGIPKINPLKCITLSKLTSERLDQTYKLRNFPSTDGPM
jgi:Zn-finger nucleic acid-binding protein